MVTVDAKDLHSAISQAIAPQLGRDILGMASSSKACAMFLEQALPSVPGESHWESSAYTGMHAALGKQYPKLAKLKNGPDADTVSQAFESRFEPTLGPQFADQMAVA